jgi:hypothetical protein
MHATATVGGHAGMLSDPSQRRILKPLLSGPRGSAEASFYAAVCAPARAHLPPAAFMPRFLGVLQLPQQPAAAAAAAAAAAPQQQLSYLALEDLTAACSRPCVLDLKMGVQSWDEDAPAEKAAAEASKWPPMASLGFRFTGMRVWREQEQGSTAGPAAASGAGAEPAEPAEPGSSRGHWVEHGKAFSRALQPEALLGALRLYLSGGSGSLRRGAAAALLAKLQLLRDFFAEQAEFRFYGSSLLFTYEGAPCSGTEESARADVRMIDFAHVWPIQASDSSREPRDSGYLLGLQTLIQLFQELLAAA